MKIIKIILVVFCLSITLTITSCIDNSNSSSESNENTKVDSSEIKRDIERKEIDKIMKIESIDYHFDSLNFRYSIDSDSILNKKVLIYDSYVDDVYKDANGYHVFLNIGINNFIRLNCTKAQAEFIANDRSERETFNIIFTPNYIRNINLELVANAELEGDDEIDAYITVDEILFKESQLIKGSLIKITPFIVND